MLGRRCDDDAGGAGCRAGPLTSSPNPGSSEKPRDRGLAALGSVISGRLAPVVLQRCIRARRAQNLERLGQPLQARDLYTESLKIKRELGDRRGMAITLAALGPLAPAIGEPETARALLRESLAVNRELGDAWGCAVTLGARAERWLAEGQAETALEAAAAARAALEGLGGGASEEAGELEALMRAARARIPADQAEARERRGRETPIMRACDAALTRSA